jgi:hypothetical protein
MGAASPELADDAQTDAVAFGHLVLREGERKLPRAARS